MSLPFDVPVLTREEARGLDRRAVTELGVSSLVLMENAGRGAADVLCALGIAGPVVVCCGRGNNAGDGFVVARHLVVRGHRVRVLAWSAADALSADAAANAEIFCRLGHSIAWIAADGDARLAAALADAEWVVDALLGTGSTGAPRAPLDGVIRQLNASGRPIVALDVPSGLDCDTGRTADPTIRATHTVTFAAYKPGLLLPEAAGYVGQLHLADIGVPVAWPAS